MLIWLASSLQALWDQGQRTVPGGTCATVGIGGHLPGRVPIEDHFLCLLSGGSHVSCCCYVSWQA